MVSEVYVRGAEWAPADADPQTTTFMEYLEAKGLGDDNYGYRLFGTGRTRRSAYRRGTSMVFDYWLAGIVTAALLVYLTYALIRPERF